MFTRRPHSVFRRSTCAIGPMSLSIQITIRRPISILRRSNGQRLLLPHLDTFWLVPARARHRVLPMRCLRALLPGFLKRGIERARSRRVGCQMRRTKPATLLPVRWSTMQRSCHLSPGDKALATKVEGLVDQLSGMWLLLTGVLSEQRKGKRVVFTLEPREEPKESKPRNAKEASRPRSVTMDYGRIPARRVLGPMNVYYYDYISERANADDLKVVERVSGRSNGEIILYETLNLVDGKRSIQAIRDYISAAYGPVPIEDVGDYLRLLDKIGVVKIE